MNVFDNFSQHLRNALKIAYFSANKSHEKFVDIGHLLFGICKEKGSVGFEILEKIRLKAEDMEKIISKKRSPIQSNTMSFSPLAIQVLERAALFASMYEHQYIGTEHLLFSIISQNNEKISRIFAAKKIHTKEITNRLKMVFKSTSKFPRISGASNKFPDAPYGFGILEHDLPLSMDMNKKSMLEIFATNLSDQKIQKNIDPVIGRENEISRIIQILSRRMKNNPLILGDPGVGKTAIVEGLAKKILLGEVPEILRNKKIYTLDLGLLIAGSSFRGEFEQRLRHILTEIKNDENIIIFIDEIHNIIGAGSAMGAMDAANMLKPSLARGEIRCIGATTMEEYKKYIENDAAFERRFQVIHIEQPSVEKTIEILSGIKANYEKYHRVLISDSAILAAAKLSHQYMQEKFLPDKAIDLIDEAASGIKIQAHSPEAGLNLHVLENEYSKIIELKRHAVMNEDYDLALDYRQKEDALLQQIAHIKIQLKNEHKKIIGTVTEKEVREVISNITHIPLEELDVEGKRKLQSMEERLKERIIGQDEAIQTVTKYLKKAWAGISDANRPLGSFIFLGPSGVGKTELAKTLAQLIFHDQKSLIRIDMSEYSESFTVSKLIGSPAGYVGYKDMNNLTDRVRKRPHSIILFDEIEKAHPLIFNLLLQILEDGHLTDSSGKFVNFKNTIIIMTSNIGSEDFNATAPLGFRSGSDAHSAAAAFEETKKSVLEKMKKFFRIEFLNRIDKIIVFQPLGLSSIKKIAMLQLGELKKKLQENHTDVDYHPSLVRFIVKKSFVPHLGARAIRKNISEYIENLIADKLLGENTNDKKMHIFVKNGKIEIE